MEEKFHTIDPVQGKIPEKAVVEKVISETDRLPDGEHEKAVKAFFFSDSIASGIDKDLAFVDKIPQLINEIIDNKSWECLYVAKGVVTPYYCRYVKGTESENFRGFITAKRPNGLETSVETLDRVLQADLEIQRKFRAIIYESRQGERKDLMQETSYGDRKKLEDELSQTQRSVIRAANRAAEAIPEIEELLDRGLIAIDIAAKLGRDIKDPDNLTAEEREYVDKRDLIGIRLKEYIYTNTIPEDEDKEPAYSRELNRFVKDLLGIKDRSNSVRMDHPKKAADKLLKFYQGEKLRELIDLLKQGLEPSGEAAEVQEIAKDKNDTHAEINLVARDVLPETTSQNSGFSQLANTFLTVNKNTGDGSYQVNPSNKGEPSHKSEQLNHRNNNATDTPEPIQEELKQPNPENIQLTLSELAERLGKNLQTVKNMIYKQKDRFAKWSQKLDPDGIAWQRYGGRKRRGESLLFIPATETSFGEKNQKENSDVIEN